MIGLQASLKGTSACQPASAHKLLFVSPSPRSPWGLWDVWLPKHKKRLGFVWVKHMRRSSQSDSGENEMPIYASSNSRCNHVKQKQMDLSLYWLKINIIWTKDTKEGLIHGGTTFIAVVTLVLSSHTVCHRSCFFCPLHTRFIYWNSRHDVTFFPLCLMKL